MNRRKFLLGSASIPFIDIKMAYPSAFNNYRKLMKNSAYGKIGNKHYWVTLNATYGKMASKK